MEHIGTGTLKEEGMLSYAFWNHTNVLLSPNELREILSIGGRLLRSSVVENELQAFYPIEEFIQNYTIYQDLCRKQQQIPSNLRSLLAPIWIYDLGDVFLQEAGEKYLIRQKRAGIQIHPHSFTISSDGLTIYPQTHGPTSIPWGIRISYPMLWENSKTKEVFKIEKIRKLPTFLLWKSAQNYIRDKTRVIKLKKESGVKATPLRIGLQAEMEGYGTHSNHFNWI